MGTILSLHAVSTVANGRGKESSDEDMPLAESVPLNAGDVEYVVRYGKDDNAEKKLVSSSCIRRLHGVMNRSLCRLLLKANCFKPTGSYIETYKLKESVAKSYDLGNCKWSDFFAGPQRHFTADAPK